MQTNVGHFQIQAKFKFLHQFLMIIDWNEPTSLLFMIIHQLEQGQIILYSGKSLLVQIFVYQTKKPLE